MSKALKKVDFGIIRYANCWEDIELMCKHLSFKGNDNVASICSGGDNSLYFLTKNVNKVVAFDLSLPQLWLTELKIAAIKKLSQPDTCSFLGFEKADNRIATYKTIKEELSKEAQMFFDAQLTEIEKGIIHTGKFEKYFALFANRVLPWIHKKSTTNDLLTPKSDQEQSEFYQKKWNTRRWKFFFKIFFSKFVMGRKGRDPKFLKEVKISVGQFIYSKAEKELTRGNCGNNFILNYNLTARFNGLLPPYLQQENFEKIKQNLHKIELVHGGIDTLQNCSVKFDIYNLSNIFEYLDEHSCNSISEQIVETANSNTQLAYWNLMVPRALSELNTAFELFLDTEKEKIHDKGFFYKRMLVEKIH